MPTSENMPPPLISVMMPAYNAERYIGLAIESLLSQTYPEWELVIVNDGSTDGTAGVIANYTDSRIRVFHQQNGGEAVARNKALAECRGEYVAFLDADDQYLPDHLEVTVKYLIEHPERDGTYTDGYYIDEAGNRLATLASHRRGPFEGDVFDDIVRASDVFGPPVCMTLRRKTIANRQLTYDASVGLGTDWHFMIRFAETTTFGYANQSTCLYRVHQENITLTTSAQKRRFGWQKCRELAIKIPRFKACSYETRWYTFYDLLVNLLASCPERQDAIMRGPEFCDLPKDAQAQLLRLTASKSIAQGIRSPHIGNWFRLAQRLNPSNVRGAVLSRLYRVSPLICEWLLHTKAALQPRPKAASPLGLLD